MLKFKRIKYNGKEYTRIESENNVTMDFTPKECYDSQIRAKKHKAKSKLKILKEYKL